MLSFQGIKYVVNQGKIILKAGMLRLLLLHIALFVPEIEDFIIM